MRLLHATDILARWRGRARKARLKGALGAVVTWIRTVSLEGDLFILETGEAKEVLSFPFPAMPGADATFLSARASRKGAGAKCGRKGRAERVDLSCCGVRAFKPLESGAHALELTC